MKIKVTGTRLLAVLCACSFVVMSVSTYFVVKQYRYFQEQAEKVVTLQAEYKNYVIAVRRLLRGSLLVVAGDEKKKNDKSVTPLVVNRSPEYLKNSSIAFFKHNKMIEELKRIQSYEWLDYTDQVLFELSQVELAKKKRAQLKALKKKRRVCHHTVKSHRVAHPVAIAVHGPKIFSWPLDPSHFYFSSFFGPRKEPNRWKFHKGLDMAAMKGTPVKAAAAGQVLQAHGDSRGYGNMILIAHDNHFVTRYAHLDKILVHVGQKVERGTIIGRVGATGNVRKMGHDGSHLHFEVHLAGNVVNPLNYVG